MINEFMILLFAHCVSDWSLQSPFMAEYKGRAPLIMTVHCIIWTGFILAALSAFKNISIFDVIFLFAGHYAMDITKVRYWEKHKELNPVGWILTVDQLFHIMQILIVMVI